MIPEVIRASFDWFQVSFSGELSAEAVKTLSELKTRAQAHHAPERLEVGLIEMFVMPSTHGFWAYEINHPEFQITLAPNAPHGAPKASLRLSSFGLANTEPSMLWQFARLCLAELGNFTPQCVSRVDVQVDFQGWEPTAEDMGHIVCPAGYRATHGTDEAWQTFMFGKGQVVLRIYNKTDELKGPKKLWLPDLWKSTGRYDPSLPVWRAEGQLRTQALQELDMKTPEQVLAQPDALLDYVLQWAQLRVPTGDQTKTRWPEDPRWTALRKAVFGGVPLNRHVKLSELMSLDQTITRMRGLVATAAAYYGTSDYMNALQRLSAATELRMMQEETDFAALVDVKGRRLMGRL